MPKAISPRGGFLIVIFICAISFMAIIYFGRAPLYPVRQPRFISSVTPSHMAEGKRIAQTICVRCHYNEETGTLAGKHHGNPKRLGVFYSGNITQDKVTGIGAWTDAQIYYLLRTGIKPDGSYVFDMPKYIRLSEDDMQGIISFLRSNDPLVKATPLANPKPEYSFITKALLYTLIRPPVFDDKKIPECDTSDKVAFGEYLATAKFSCFDCHSGNMVFVNYNFPERSWHFFEGGNPHVNEEGEKVYSANLTPDDDTGIGKWSEDDFIKAVKNGIRPDGTSVRDPMFPFYLLSDEEARAIYIYLRSLKPVHRKANHSFF